MESLTQHRSIDPAARCAGDQITLSDWHRTLVVTRKGGKVVTIPFAPHTARAIDLAIGERTDGPIFVTADGRPLARHGAARIVRRAARRAGIAKRVGPHTLRHAFIAAALDPGVALRDVQETGWTDSATPITSGSMTCMTTRRAPA